jgi:hypothetical protein
MSGSLSANSDNTQPNELYQKAIKEKEDLIHQVDLLR